MKRMISVLAAVMMLLTLTVPFTSAQGAGVGLGTMYVYTANGKTLNVRSTPETGDNLVGSLRYGEAVSVVGFEGSWARIRFAGVPGGTAWVQSRFLQ